MFVRYYSTMYLVLNRLFKSKNNWQNLGNVLNMNKDKWSTDTSGQLPKTYTPYQLKTTLGNSYWLYLVKYVILIQMSSMVTCAMRYSKRKLHPIVPTTTTTHSDHHPPTTHTQSPTQPRPSDILMK